MRRGEKIKKGISTRKIGSISLPWEPQILKYDLGWEKAFRIPRGKKPPWKTSEEGGIDGGLGQNEKLGAIWPLLPPLGLKTKYPALWLKSKVSFSFERQYWSIQGTVPGQSNLDPNPGSTIY